jgi:AcrR family transcriptional regulator
VTDSSARSELSPRAREIVAVARLLLEEEGLEGLSMRRLADRLGIRAPSLYKHFADKQELEAALISDAFEEQAAVFETALADAADPLAAIAAAYRAFATAHPHLYRLMTERPLEREKLVPGVEARAGRPVYEAVGEDVDLARATWAFAHGMTNLELNGRFPAEADLDAAWERGVAAFRAQPSASAKIANAAGGITGSPSGGNDA